MWTPPRRPERLHYCTWCVEDWTGKEGVGLRACSTHKDSVVQGKYGLGRGISVLKGEEISPSQTVGVQKGEPFRDRPTSPKSLDSHNKPSIWPTQGPVSTAVLVGYGCPLRAQTPSPNLPEEAKPEPSPSGTPHPSPYTRAPGARPGRRGKLASAGRPRGESVNGRPGGSSSLARPRHAGAGSADDRCAWGRRRAPLSRCSAWKCLH